VWALLLLAVLVLVSVLAAPSGVPVRDEPDFLVLAERLLAGWYADASPDADPRLFLWHGPGLPALLAPLVAAGVPLELLRLTGALLIWAALLLFYRLARRDVAERAALLWTGALALYLPFYAVLRQLQKEPLAMFLLCLAAFTLTRGLRAGRAADLVGAGACLAALAMVRLEYGWVIIGVLVLALGWWAVGRAKAQARRLAAAAAVALALCAPWLGYTATLMDEPLAWSSSSGLSLYWMSPTGNGETGGWHSPASVATDAYLSPYRPFFARVQRLPPAEQDRVLREAAVRNIRAEPLLYARNVAANASRMVTGVPSSAGWTPAVTFGLIAVNGLLLAALASGFVRLRRRAGSTPPEVVAVGLLVACSIGVHLAASASPRMLTPVVPLLAWLALQGRLAAVTSARSGVPSPRARRRGGSRPAARPRTIRTAGRSPTGRP
jgi:4-amino-4-deoxy-L-arabinose transferase-like glycosyltransferase